MTQMLNQIVTTDSQGTVRLNRQAHGCGSQDPGHQRGQDIPVELTAISYRVATGKGKPEMQCPNCGNQNADGCDFCEECGASMTSAGAVAVAQASTVASAGMRQCPCCHGPVSVEDALCFKCGTPMPWALPVGATSGGASSVAVSVVGTAPPDPSTGSACSAGSTGPTGTGSAGPTTCSTGSTAAPIAHPPHAGTLAPCSSISFTMTVDSGSQAIPFTGAEMLFGRLDPKTRVFPQVDIHDPGISRRHLASGWSQPAIASWGRTWRVEMEQPSMDSHGPRETVELHDGDLLKLGKSCEIRIHMSAIQPTAIE